MSTSWPGFWLMQTSVFTLYDTLQISRRFFYSLETFFFFVMWRSMRKSVNLWASLISQWRSFLCAKFISSKISIKRICLCKGVDVNMAFPTPLLCKVVCRHEGPRIRTRTTVAIWIHNLAASSRRSCLIVLSIKKWHRTAFLTHFSFSFDL